MTTTVCVLGCETNKKYVLKINFQMISSYFFKGGKKILSILTLKLLSIDYDVIAQLHDPF